MENLSVNQGFKYLTFGINQEVFGIDTIHVVEILKLSEYTIVPNSSENIKGILNYRGDIVPVVYMYKRFNMAINDKGAKMVVIVDLEYNNTSNRLGLLVDNLYDVIDVNVKDIRNVPGSGFNFSEDFLTGIVNINNKIYYLLDTKRALDIRELGS